MATPHLPMHYTATEVVESPLGPTTLFWDEVGLCAHHWAGAVAGSSAHSPKGIITQQTAVKDWLAAYWRGENPTLELAWLDASVGTAFERAVWRALCSVPYGHTCTYTEVAHLLGKTATAARAVGRAVGRNPWAVLVPCHRVIGRDGSLTGFAWGLSRKMALLEREGIRQNQLSLFGT